MHRNCQMFQQGEKVYFIRENENKRQYPVLPVSENIKKKNHLTILMLLTLLTYGLCQSQQQRKV